MEKFYTEEMDEWLRDNFPYLSYQNLERKFNKKFDAHRTWSGLKNRCLAYLHLHRTLEEKRILRPRFSLKGEHRKWLDENFHSNSMNEVVAMFKQKFGLTYSNHYVERTISESGYRKTKDETYQQRSRNSERFTGRPSKKKKYHAGDEYMDSYGNIRVVLSDETGKILSLRSMSKGVMLYEKYHNCKVDGKNYKVIHLDGDKTNFEKENLILVSNYEVGHLTMEGYYGYGRATESALNTIRVEKFVKDFKNEQLTQIQTI